MSEGIGTEGAIALFHSRIIFVCTLIFYNRQIVDYLNKWYLKLLIIRLINV